MFSKPRIPPKLGQLARLVRNANTHGFNKDETCGSEVNKCQTTNTPAQAFRNGLLKVDVPVVQALLAIATLLGPIVLCQSNNALRHT
jgi:hypothetical protein